jgi:O-antigen/teichoic acid export membrane protein
LLPGVLLLTLLGGPLLEVWMGGRFANAALIAVLALGHLVVFSQRGTYQVLMGMNRHGLPAVADVAASIVGIGLTAILIGVFDLGLIGAALGLVVPMTLVNLLVTPVYACRVLQVPFWGYIRRSTVKPFLLALPFGAVLALGRALLSGGPAVTLCISVGAAGAVYLALMWCFALAPEQRRRVLRWMRLRPRPGNAGSGPSGLRQGEPVSAAGIEP